MTVCIVSLHRKLTFKTKFGCLLVDRLLEKKNDYN